MNAWNKRFTQLHIKVYELTNGRIGNQLGKQSMLLLYTVGRKSGQRRSTSLSYYRDGTNYLVVASNWGEENSPDWYYNLMQQPQTIIQVGTKTIKVKAKLAPDDQYQRLWQLVTKKNQQIISYQKRIRRRIQIVILEPITL